MSKKKGFTLIELLAVILVLTLILVIAVPKILEIIENADKRAYKESVELMAHTAKIQYQTKEVTGSAPLIPDNGIVYTFEEGEFISSDKLNFKGDKPYSGTIILTKDKKVIIEKLVSKNKKWCAIKEAGEKQARVGRSTDPEFACIIEPDAPIEDKKPCEMEIGTEEIDGEEKEIYYIDSPSDLYALSQSVNSGNTYSGKIIKVRNNLDMSTAKGECVTDFNPIGNSSNKFSGTFDGNAKTISNLEINKPDQEYVGLFGYAYYANIYGIKLKRINVIGKNSVGTLSGTLWYSQTKEIQIEESEVTSTKERIGIVSGYYGYGNMNNVLVKSGTVNYSGTDYVGIFSGYSQPSNSIVENLTMNIPNVTTMPYLDIWSESYYSNNLIINGVNVTNGFNTESIGDISFYESAGLDTWIGADNDSSGYYFDITSSGNVELLSTKTNPINEKPNLEGEGTEESPYIIKTAADWKQMASRPNIQAYYKLNNDIDFSGKDYYMLGSKNSHFNGKLNGNNKTISNINIVPNISGDCMGVFGKTALATIEKLNIENIKIKSKLDTSNSYYKYIGVIGSDESSTINELFVNNAELIGTNYVGVIGESHYSTVSVVKLSNIKVIGNDRVGTLSGTSWYSKTKEIQIEESEVTSTKKDVGIVSGYYGYEYMNNVLVKSGTVNYNGTDYVGIFSGYSQPSNSIVENLTMNIPNANVSYPQNYETSFYSNNIIINSNNVTNGFNNESIGDISFYEVAGLDTWVGGDSDSTGYYFDIISNDNIELVSVKNHPTPEKPNLNGSGTKEDPYLISNATDWKQMALRPNLGLYYKINSNIDFSENDYYIIGSDSHIFNGHIDGNEKIISNVNIIPNVGRDLGMFGIINSGSLSNITFNNIKVYGNQNYGYEVGLISESNYGTFNKLFFNNVEIKGYNYVGIFGNFYYSTLNVLMAKNINVYGYAEVGSVMGMQTGGTQNEMQVEDIIVNGKDEYISSVIGKKYQGSTNNILVKNGTINYTGTDNVGIATGYFYSDKTIVENLEINAPNGTVSYPTSNIYYSNNVIVNGANVTNGFDPAYVGDLDYYADIVETLYNGDLNNTGYFFDYVPEKNGIYLVKAYTPVESSTPAEKTGCKIEYGDRQQGCYLYKSGVHGNYLYEAASSEDTETGGACTGTSGRFPAYRTQIIYNCS